jgi:chromosome segregation ATPase
MEEDEYEIIPTSPLRRLERRIHKLEAGSSASEVRKLIEEIIELIKANQTIIDDIVKSNSELRNEISKVPSKIDQLLGSMKEFIDLLKVSANEDTVTEMSKDVMEPVVKKIDELIKQNKEALEQNQSLLEGIGTVDKRLKRLNLQFAGTSGYRQTQ